MPPIESIHRAQQAAIRQQQEAGNLPKLLLTDAEAEQVTGLCASYSQKLWMVNCQ